MARVWTALAKAQHSEKMRAKWAERRAAQDGNLPATPAISLNGSAEPPPPAWPHEYRLSNFIDALWWLAREEGVRPERVRELFDHSYDKNYAEHYGKD
jgi:hypothetical protein